MRVVLDPVMEWLTLSRHARRGLAVTRMVLGFIIWTQLLINAPDRHYTWGDGTAWTEPLRGTDSWPWFLGGFVAADGRLFDLLYVLTIVAGFLLMIGWRTRTLTVLTLLLWMSLYTTNPFVGSGGDAVLRMVLLYLCFTEAGAFWSLDARRGRRGPLLPDWFGTTLHNLAVVLIIHQVVIVYVASALWKVQSSVWLDGTAVYFPLQTEAYSPWRDLLHPLTSAEPIVLASTWLALVVQLMFPVMLLYRPTRIVGLLLVTGMHLGIGVFMGIMYFSLVMIAVDMMLVSDVTWRRLEAFVKKRRSADPARIS
ncbi:HTTM domain-containing protein [Aeromicrobium sp. CTD01-1L150]|uniref:HTTM domain-containing protein n=1 Tax=Aeromicrobium sp. CTD01-1L150 TaxID=3341830 RepID=UPI0035C02D9B